jgi:hypothetical protein
MRAAAASPRCRRRKGRARSGACKDLDRDLAGAVCRSHTTTFRLNSGLWDEWGGTTPACPHSKQRVNFERFVVSFWQACMSSPRRPGSVSGSTRHDRSQRQRARHGTNLNSFAKWGLSGQGWRPRGAARLSARAPRRGRHRHTLAGARRTAHCVSRGARFASAAGADAADASKGKSKRSGQGRASIRQHFPHACGRRCTKGRADVGASKPGTGLQRPAQPALCRRLRLRAKPLAQTAQWANATRTSSA